MKGAIMGNSKQRAPGILASVAGWSLPLLALWLGVAYGGPALELVGSLLTTPPAEEGNYDSHGFSTRMPEAHRLAGYLDSVDGTTLSLEITNPSVYAVDLMAVRVADAVSVPIEPPLRLPPFGGSLEYKKILVELPEGMEIGSVDPEMISLEYQREGAGPGEALVYPYPIFAPGLMEDDLFRQPWTLPEAPFVRVDSSSREVVFLPGAWTISTDITVPAGYRVVLSAGFELTLTNGAMFVTRSPISAEGTADAPIVFDSSGGEGEGIAVLRPGGESVLRHVVFRNLSPPQQGGWELTGAVTFYEAPVSIADARFVGCRAEDCLNIVRSSYSVRETTFESSSFDAFDSDFSDGIIDSSRFMECGNDCLDFSGSEVAIRNVTFYGAGDKAISVGERSRVTGRDIEIENAVVGIASKDLSLFEGRDIQISHTETPYAAYRKKPEFGGGTLRVTGSVLGSGVGAVERDALSSIAIVDRSSAEPQDETVFFVAGHVHAWLAGEFRQAIPRINGLDPDFGVLTGDVVLDSTEENWATARSILAELNAPYFVAPGNHDLYKTGLPLEEASRAAEFEEMFGARYTSFRDGPNLFLLLDTVTAERGPRGDLDEQMRYFGSVLRENEDVQNVFVFMHYLLFVTPEGRYSCLKGHVHYDHAQSAPDKNLWRFIESQIDVAQGPKVFVFAGDLGTPDEPGRAMAPAFYDRTGNVTIFAGGMGNQPLAHYFVVRVLGERVDVEMVPFDEALGKLRPEDFGFERYPFCREGSAS